MGYSYYLTEHCGENTQGSLAALELRIQASIPSEIQEIIKRARRERKTDVLVIWKLLGREERTYFYHTMF